MANNFYLGQIIIGYWPLPSTTPADEEIRRVPLSLGQKFIQNHSNLLLSPQPEDKTWEVQIAWLQTHNVFLLNLALILDEREEINFARLDAFARDTPLRGVGRCHPFIRIYIVGHTDIGAERISYGNPSKHIPLFTFANVIFTILMGPNGIYNTLPMTRVRASPLQCKISILGCYSSSGIDPHTHTTEQQALHRSESTAGRLNDLLKILPIPHVIVGRVYPLNIRASGKKRQSTVNIRGIPREARLTLPTLRHIPAMKKLHHWDAERGISVRDAEYGKPSFLTKPFFGKIYTLLIMLQEELSRSSQPRLFQDIIYDILEILDQIPLHAEEDMNTCLAVNMYLREYAASHTALMNAETRVAFDRILSFFQR